MKRILLAVSAVAVLTATLFTVVDTGVAGAAPHATGAVVCSITGKGSFSPPLTLAGSATALGINFAGGASTTSSTSSCFSNASIPNSAGALTPVNITGVSVSGIGKLVPLGPGLANKCSVFKASDTIAVVKVTYTWASTPAIAPTVVTYTGGSAHIVSGTPTDKIILPATSGTTTVTSGSFSPAVHPLVGLRTNISSTCAAGWGPYPTFTINPGSVISLP